MKDYKKRLLKIFIPIMLSNLISQVQMLIDRIFLGRINIQYMTAVGNATAPVWTTMSFVFSLSLGASILISQSVGAEDMDKAKEYSASLIKFHNIIPVLLFLFWTFASPLVFKLMGVQGEIRDMCVSYTRIYAPVFLLTGIGGAYTVVFQTSNYTKPFVAYGIIRSGVNIILDWLLIFGNWGFPRMEINGAALGTTISEFLGFLYVFWVVIAKKDKFSTAPTFSQIMKSKALPYFKSVKLGVNSALEDFTWNFGNLAIIRILNSIDENAAGVYTMVFTVEVLFVVVIGALGNGTMTLTGEATGSSDLKLYRRVTRTAMIWSGTIALVGLIFVSIFPRQVLGIFTKDVSVIESSVMCVILVMVNLFGKSGNIIVGNSIRGYGDTRWMLITQIVGTFNVVGLAALFVYVFGWGIKGVYFAVIADELLRAFVNFIRFMKVKF